MTIIDLITGPYVFLTLSIPIITIILGIIILFNSFYWHVHIICRGLDKHLGKNVSSNNVVEIKKVDKQPDRFMQRSYLVTVKNSSYHMTVSGIFLKSFVKKDALKGGSFI